jgi:hypothetical protein
MKRILITRTGSKVNFETVNVDNTENVFYINLDPQQPHFPSLASNKLGPAPSPPSSQCQPDPTGTLPQVIYKCLIPGHQNESGIINIFQQLAETNTTLSQATHGQPITEQQVVLGGMSPYQISGEVFEVVGPNNAVIQAGSGIGPGLQLVPKNDNSGVWVSGTPTIPGTYKFTFVVDDGMGGNLQQVQYKMIVL